jgi:hypothetical protein
MSEDLRFKPTIEQAWILLSFLFNKTKGNGEKINGQEATPDTTIWEVIYPPTSKPFNVNDAETLTKLLAGSLKDDIKDFVDRQKTEDEGLYYDYNDIKTKNEKGEMAQVPIYEVEKSGNLKENIDNLGLLRLKFQGIVRDFIKKERNPAVQLTILNKIQKNTHFNLFNLGSQSTLDTIRQKSKDSPAMQSLKYGYADLLRFLCAPVKSGEVARLTKMNPLGERYVVDRENGEYVLKHNKYVKATGNVADNAVRYRKEQTVNPFYSPIQYDAPDTRANEMLERLYVGARQYYTKKLAELAYLRKELDAKPSKERRKSILENMLLILRQIHDNRFDPIYLSKQIKGQERPMETYKNEHFYELLEQLSTRKRLHPMSLGTKPPNNSDIEISSPPIDKLQRKLAQDLSTHKHKTHKTHKTHKSKSTHKKQTNHLKNQNYSFDGLEEKNEN